MKKSRILFTAYLTLCTALLFHVGASAYIDPSVVSGLVTAIAGVAVACSAAFFVIWRRVRSKVSKTLGIDENAGKEVEDELSISEEAAGELDRQDNKEQK